MKSNIIWLGGQTGKDIAGELSRCSVAVFPSFIESYGITHVESMAVGTPCVCAYNGGYSYLGEDEKTTLFFPPGDHIMCAFLIQRLLSDKRLSESLSNRARSDTLKRNDKLKILSNQLDIYKKVLNLG